MDLSPEDELMVLLSCAEDSWELGRVENFRWNAERPGNDSFIDFSVDCEGRGLMTLEEVYDPESQRTIMRGRLTPAGNSRIARLLDDGVEATRPIDADDYFV